MSVAVVVRDTLFNVTEQKLSGVSGILGKRTRFQQKDISQLVLHVTATEDDKTVETLERGHEECAVVKLEQELLPKV